MTAHLLSHGPGPATADGHRQTWQNSTSELCKDLDMTIEDEGIEPDFELDWGKTTGKRDAMKINSTSPHDDKSCSRGKGKLNNGSGKISNGDANGFILEAKRQLKRKLALESEQNGGGSGKARGQEKYENKEEKKMKKITDSATNAEEHIEGKKQDSAPNPQQNPAKYKELLERLSSIKKEGEARQMITAEVAAGKLEKSEIMTVLRMWRQQKRRKMQAENKDKLAQMDGTLEELKKTVNDLVRKGKLRGKDAGDIIRRWKMREKRRVERQVAKQTNRSCFHCRQQGHVLADCPNRGEGDQTVGNMATLHGDGICFKCGSTEHNVHKCPRKNVKGFPYATCFVCGQQGHLSRDCEKNANGIYPDGGGCNVCGSTKHLKRDCPELAAQKQKKDERKVTIRTMSAMSSADADDIPEEQPKEERKKPKKVVLISFITSPAHLAHWKFASWDTHMY
ncbi:hypothetical protein ANCCEY_01872 [Ancylostoma ceylanicum]|uniref:CCHC-type domain-containing protein n=1 Tax=Ancylostoma ceylanicum TaxID=53326 RepID=A0A0D6M4E5_9BILA|nr:hypothetical protein ANCCEY_01872 [Ancylostoma ceylanicum]